MRGLLRRDLSVTGNYFIKSLLLIYVVFSGLYAFFDSIFFSMYMVGMGASLITNTISIDEKERWNYYYPVLPVTKKDIVYSKYITGLIAFTVMTMLTMLSMSVTWLIKGEFELSNLIYSFLGMSAFGLLWASILVPVTYKFGTENAMFYLILFIVVGSIMATFILASIGADNLDENEMKLRYVGIPFLIGLAVYYLSCRISVKICEAKEL